MSSHPGVIEHLWDFLLTVVGLESVAKLEEQVATVIV